MASTFTWSITNMTANEQVGDYSNVVNKIFYSCTAVDGDAFKTVTGVLDIALDPDNTFILYENLTQDDVLNWLWEHGVDQSAIESDLDSAIHQPNNVVLPLPWTTDAVQ